MNDAHEKIKQAHKALDRFEKKYTEPKSYSWKVTGFPATLIWLMFLVIQVLGVWKLFELLAHI